MNAAAHDIVFLLDVDNTLLDNDRVIADLRLHLVRELGPAHADRYWAILEELRNALGYVDYLGALQHFRIDAELGRIDDSRLLQLSSFLVDYPFAERLYLGALEVIRQLTGWGPTVLLSDGDVVFQPLKVQRSGLWQAVSGRVLVFTHKEEMLERVQHHYPARHYVMVDDKLRILAVMKAALLDRMTTVFARQGHYALDPANVAAYPAADLSIASIGELRATELQSLLMSTAGLRGPA